MTESYTAARIHVMRTKLIHSADYERLMRMSDKELISFLQSTEYREDVDTLALKDLEDLAAIDKIIASNMQRTLRKLARIAKPQFRNVLRCILLKNDLWNLSIIAEAITGHHDVAEAIETYGKYGTVPVDHFKKITTLAEAAGMLRKIFPRTGGVEFLDSLHRARIPSNEKSLKYLTDERNILLLVKFKREGIGAEHIAEYLDHNGTVSVGILQEAASQNLEHVFSSLHGTKYGETMARAQEHLRQGSLIRFEDELHRGIQKRIYRLTRAHPLGVDLMIHYLIEKEAEHENIRLLVKGKRLGLNDTFIREYLVV